MEDEESFTDVLTQLISALDRASTSPQLTVSRIHSTEDRTTPTSSSSTVEPVVTEMSSASKENSLQQSQPGSSAECAMDEDVLPVDPPSTNQVQSVHQRATQTEINAAEPQKLPNLAQPTDHISSMEREQTPLMAATNLYSDRVIVEAEKKGKESGHFSPYVLLARDASSLSMRDSTPYKRPKKRSSTSSLPTDHHADEKVRKIQEVLYCPHGCGWIPADSEESLQLHFHEIHGK